MRDPLCPIPSPSVATPSAERFWSGALPPPLPTQREILEPPSPGPIDRRRARRDRSPAPPDRTEWRAEITSAIHEPVRDAILGLTSRHGWTLCRGLALGPGGLLVRGIDPLDPVDAEHAQRILPTLAPMLGAAQCGVHSLLGLVGGCVLAPRLLEALARSGSHRAALPVTLLVPLPTRRAGDPPALAVDGLVAPLNDPGRDVLGIALGGQAHARLRPHLLAESARRV